MRLIKADTHFDFLGKRKLSFIVSSLAILAGIAGYFLLGGLNYGIDFRGGTLVQVRIPETGDINRIRQALSDGGVNSFSLQSFGEVGGHEYMITLGKAEEATGPVGESESARVEGVLKEHFPSLTVRRVESVGPKVGGELRLAASLAILFSLVAILLYVWLRFQWRYSVGAVVALFHDVLVVLAAFILTGKEITLPVVAAILTVAGYSINDTIVIFDRIRENLRKFQKKALFDNFNESINQTLSRTVLTSGTTLLVVLAMYLFGGEIINDFAYALLIGIVVGTYSSVFVAAPLVFNLLNLFPPKLK
jgi:preprotein translocase subunit SecF